jgi:hypothetical protein
MLRKYRVCKFCLEVFSCGNWRGVKCVGSTLSCHVYPHMATDFIGGDAWHNHDEVIYMWQMSFYEVRGWSV